jgi:hypothetical protein
MCLLSDRQLLKIVTIIRSIQNDTEHVGVQQVHVLTYGGTEGSEMAARSVRAGSGHPLIRSEPAFGILESS